VGTPAATRSQADGNDVRLSRLAADTLHELSDDAAETVAETIDRIGVDRGQSLKIPRSKTGGTFYAMVPTDKDGPVVIYRRLAPDEGEGFLVTAIINRQEYVGYLQAERRGALDTPLGQFLLGVAAGVVTHAVIRSLRP
jgi:hypothetical protein